MTAHSVFELKVGAAMIGVLELWLAAIAAFANGRDPLSRALSERGLSEPWAAIMALLGCLVLYGSIFPRRSCRHIGLGLTALIMVAVLTVVAKAKLLTMTAGVLLFIVVFCLVLLGIDSIRGARGRANAERH
jgi:branched-subunit amino acid transport protein AzlD